MLLATYKPYKPYLLFATLNPTYKPYKPCLQHTLGLGGEVAVGCVLFEGRVQGRCMSIMGTLLSRRC